MRTFIYNFARRLMIHSLTYVLQSLEQQEVEQSNNERFMSLPETLPETAETDGMSGGTGNTVVGLLGGGQLGRMLCQAAGPLGIDVAVLDEENSPAKQVHQSGRHVTGSFKDRARIRELAARSDFLTVEIEHVDTEVLEDIAKNGVQVELPDGSAVTHFPPVHPCWKTLRKIQDKFEQKEHFRTGGGGKKIPVADQMAIASGEAVVDSLKEAAQRFGFPFMLKARKGSYDGRGNFKVSSVDDFVPAIKALGTLPLYAEKWAPFTKELAVMVIRTEDDEGNLKSCVAYPAVETIHEDSICTKVFMPPREVSEIVCQKARQLACDVISTLWGRGVFAVEMFVLEDGSLVVNEVAPRPHNSGHYTIEAVPQMSQFKAQLHAVLDLPVPENLAPRVSSAIMLNILGGADAISHHKLSKLARTVFHDLMDVHLHLYGKEPKPGRKIGHITLTGFCPIQQLEMLAEPFIRLVDQIREERLSKAAEQLRPQEEPTAPEVNNVHHDEVGESSSSAPVPVNGETVVNGPTSDDVSAVNNVKPAPQKPVVVVQRKLSKKGREVATKALQPKRASQSQLASSARNGPLVLVTMGSDSDLPVLKAGLDILEEFKVPYVTRITSAHRTAKLMMRVAEEAASQGFKVIIAAAGGAAHLPGMMASETPLPVIGVPVKASQLDGLDSLFSIVQMPRGCPTATVGINNSTNAALLAIRILGIAVPKYQEQMLAYQHKMEETNIEKDEKITKLGGLAYLTQK